MLPILIGKSLPKLDNLKVVVKNIYSVLVTFKLILFARRQSLVTRVRSLFTLAYSSAWIQRTHERERGKEREGEGEREREREADSSGYLLRWMGICYSG